MIKNEVESNARIKALVRSFIECERLLILPVDEGNFNTGHTTKFFRYESLSNRLIKTLQSKKNGTFTLKSSNDVEIIIRKGNAVEVNTVVTIKNSELCFENI